MFATTWLYDFADPLICILWGGAIFTALTILFAVLKLCHVIHRGWKYIWIVAGPAILCDIAIGLFIFLIMNMRW